MGIPMMKMALCDDCKEDRVSILDCLARLEEDRNLLFDTSIFEDGQSLCESIKENSYDVILLDIMMTGLDGIETARRIRSMGEDSRIIYISSHDERLRELLRVGAIAFLDKPIKYSDLEHVLLQAWQMIQEEKETIFCYRKNGKPYFIPIRDILYFESNKNLVIIHARKVNISYTQSLIHIWEEVKQYDVFVMPAKSYIVNLKYFYLNQNTIQLGKNKESINIGRAYKEETMNRYLDYMNRRLEQ